MAGVPAKLIVSVPDASLMVSLPSPSVVVRAKRYVSLPSLPSRMLLPLLPVITLSLALPVPSILDVPVRVRVVKFVGKVVVVEAVRSSLRIVPVTAVVVPTL